MFINIVNSAILYDCTIVNCGLDDGKIFFKFLGELIYLFRGYHHFVRLCITFEIFLERMLCFIFGSIFTIENIFLGLWIIFYCFFFIYKKLVILVILLFVNIFQHFRNFNVIFHGGLPVNVFKLVNLFLAASAKMLYFICLMDNF